MEGEYLSINDGYGIVGYAYKCPKCGHETMFTDCESGCEECEFTEPFVDPDEWNGLI